MPCLQISGADVVDDGISEDIVFRIPRLYTPGVFSDDHAQFRLIIQTVHQTRIRGNRIARPGQTADSLGKINRIRALSAEGLFGKTARFFGMFVIINSQTHHILPRMYHRGADLHAAEIHRRKALFLFGQPFQFRLLPRSHTVDQVVHIRKIIAQRLQQTSLILFF